jgi:hypothetical protein
LRALIIRFIGLLKLVVTRIIELSLIHTIYSSLQHAPSPLSRSLVTAPNAVSMPRLLFSKAGTYLTTKSSLSRGQSYFKTGGLSAVNSSCPLNLMTRGVFCRDSTLAV